jgi:hypothetical protein
MINVDDQSKPSLSGRGARLSGPEQAALMKTPKETENRTIA